VPAGGLGTLGRLAGQWAAHSKGWLRVRNWSRFGGNCERVNQLEIERASWVVAQRSKRPIVLQAREYQRDFILEGRVSLGRCATWGSSQAGPVSVCAQCSVCAPDCVRQTVCGRLFVALRANFEQFSGSQLAVCPKRAQDCLRAAQNSQLAIASSPLTVCRPQTVPKWRVNCRRNSRLATTRSRPI